MGSLLNWLWVYRLFNTRASLRVKHAGGMAGDGQFPHLSVLPQLVGLRPSLQLVLTQYRKEAHPDETNIADPDTTI